MRNGAVIAATGEPIAVTAGSEHYGDAILDADGNTAGDYYVIATTVYTFGQLRDGAGATLGDTFFVVRLPADTCPWDLDRDGIVGVTDLLAVLAAWGTAPGGPPDFDLNGDVGVTDPVQRQERHERRPELVNRSGPPDRIRRSVPERVSARRAVRSAQESWRLPALKPESGGRPGGSPFFHSYIDALMLLLGADGAEGEGCQ